MKTIKYLSIIVLSMYFGAYLNHADTNSRNKTPHEANISMELNDSTLLSVIEQAKIKHPQIVLKQAKLESGNYSSNVFINYNNLFGLYNSKKKDYYSFDTWQESVYAYKWLVQRKYKDGCYYAFLQQLPYAEDKDYIHKLIRM